MNDLHLSPLTARRTATASTAPVLRTADRQIAARSVEMQRWQRTRRVIALLLVCAVSATVIGLTHSAGNAGMSDAPADGVRRAAPVQLTDPRIDPEMPMLFFGQLEQAPVAAPRRTA